MPMVLTRLVTCAWSSLLPAGVGARSLRETRLTHRCRVPFRKWQEAAMMSTRSLHFFVRLDDFTDTEAPSLLLLPASLYSSTSCSVGRSELAINLLFAADEEASHQDRTGQQVYVLIFNGCQNRLLYCAFLWTCPSLLHRTLSL